MQKVKLNNIEKQDFRTRESYKTLRTNLEFAGKNRKVVAVTSCTPNEGKSSVSFQLALSMAESGKRVALVDADLRKSVLRSLYHVNAARYGLSHYLSGQASLSDVLCETNIPGFYVIFAGPVPPNPSELLGGEPFALMLDYLRREYDYVVVDTPPLGRVIDGAVIARQCDGAVFVIESGAVSYRFAQSVKEQLDKAGCRVLGVALNKVDVGSVGYYGKYYGKYYGRYYGNYGADEEGSLNDAVGNGENGRGEKPLTARSEKPSPIRNEKSVNGRSEKPVNGRNEKPADVRNEKPADGRNEKTGKTPERTTRPDKKDKAAARKAAQGTILLLDEEELDFVTLDGEDPAPPEKGENAWKKDRTDGQKVTKPEESRIGKEEPTGKQRNEEDTPAGK